MGLKFYSIYVKIYILLRQTRVAMIIPVLYETNFSEKSIWCDNKRTAIEQYAIAKKHKIEAISGESFESFDYDAFFQDTPRIAIVLGSSTAWINKVLDFFQEHQIMAVLIGDYASEHPSVAANICADYNDLVSTLVSHLEACGCKRLALYGSFKYSGADLQKQDAFCSAMRSRGINEPEKLCFENKSNYKVCLAGFKPHMHEFDGVICVNDIAAVLLMEQLKKDGIKVPEQLQIVSCGSNTELAAAVTPPLTTIEMSDVDIGQTAVLTYRHCCNTFEVPTKAKVSNRFSIILGGTSRLLEKCSNNGNADSDATDGASADGESSAEALQINFYNDPEVVRISSIEKTLRHCDSTDLSLLKMFDAGKSYEEMSEELYISRGSIFYRLRRIEDNLKIRSHSELKNYLYETKFGDILGD